MSMNAVLPKTLLQVTLALLTVMGGVIPWYFNLQFMSLHAEFSIERFVADGFANPASASLSADLVIAAAAGVSFILIEARRLKMRFAWVYVVLACLISFACAFPMFLYMREIHLAGTRSSLLDQSAST